MTRFYLYLFVYAAIYFILTVIYKYFATLRCHKVGHKWRERKNKVRCRRCGKRRRQHQVLKPAK